MSDTQASQSGANLILDYELDAPPDKVWRAISIPELREHWLPEMHLADADPISAEPGEEIRYRMREKEPPFLESIVTFQLAPSAHGGTRLRIVHYLSDARTVGRAPPAANSNRRMLMRAA